MATSTTPPSSSARDWYLAPNTLPTLTPTAESTKVTTPMKPTAARMLSTCKKAKNWLDENGLEYDSRNIKEENPTYEEVKEWYSRSGLPLKRFFNTSGMLYKSMGLKDKLESMSEDEQLSLLATDGMLVKRPLIIADNVILTGFRQKEWEEKLK